MPRERVFDEEHTMGDADWTRVWVPAPEDQVTGRPVILAIRSGIAGLQDYYTPDEAEQLADALKRAAAAARGAGESAAASEPTS